MESVRPSEAAWKICRAAAYTTLLALVWLLLFYNLAGHLLWGDEAETATLARNVAHFGVPKTYDGLNRITLFGPAIDSKNDLWTWSPWLQEYITAGSFKLFGTTTWAARAPFALIGWSAVGLLGFVAHRIYRSHKIALAAMALLGSSEIFLLHARQCRYYSISIFVEILLILGVYQLLGEKRIAITTVAVALVLQFYSNYIIAAANIPALLVAGWFLFRRSRDSVWRLSVALGIAALAVAPWLVFAEPWRVQTERLGHQNLAVNAARYIIEFNFHFLPFVFLLLPVVPLIKRQMSRQQDLELEGMTELERILLILVPTFLAVIVFAPGYYIRYLLPVLPIACFLVSAWLFRYCRIWIALLLIAVQCATNVLAVVSGFPWRGEHPLGSPLFQFAEGIGHPYSSRLKDVVEFLNTHAKPGQTLMVLDPEFPLQFYTKLKIIDARLTQSFPENFAPDWILPESASGMPMKYAAELPDELKPRYETVVINVHDSRRVGGIPDPHGYEFDTAPLKAFVIYRKK